VYADPSLYQYTVTVALSRGERRRPQTPRRVRRITDRARWLVILSACSHAGLINVLTEARNRFPAVPLHAVIGGFHLSEATVEKIIPETVRDLARFDPRWIVPSHCTGWRAVTALVNAFGEARVVPNAVGKKLVF